jgi:hypothetical protein
MIFEVIALSLVGFFAIIVVMIGLKRSRVVAIPPLNVTRNERPSIFWLGIFFQAASGLISLLLVIDRIIPLSLGKFVDEIAG